MTMGNVIRLMETKDLLAVPDARKEFEKHGTHGDYFFFVIVKLNSSEDTDEEIIGYIIAKKEEKKLRIKTFSLDESLNQERYLYKNTAFSNLYDYVEKIKCKNNERFIFQIGY